MPFVTKYTALLLTAVTHKDMMFLYDNSIFLFLFVFVYTLLACIFIQMLEKKKHLKWLSYFH